MFAKNSKILRTVPKMFHKTARRPKSTKPEIMAENKDNFILENLNEMLRYHIGSLRGLF